MSEATTRQQTLGEYRVGLDFNPSGDDRVTTIKRMAADFIDYLDGLNPPAGNTWQTQEFGRLRALAMTHIEDAAMWSVKAVTKRPR